MKHTPAPRRLAPSLVSVALLVACQGGAIVPDEPGRGADGALDWTVGTWEGVRRDAAAGDESAMTMRVTRILGGAGQTREMEIVHSGGVYRGFCVQVYDSELDRWTRQYVNDVRRTYALLEGDVGDDGASVWRGASATRTRESRVVSERPSADAWRRTMSVSEDGGETWTALWIDELRRK